MLTGTIKKRDGKLYVVIETVFENEPRLERLWWRIDSIHSNTWTGQEPSVGDEAFQNLPIPSSFDSFTTMRAGSTSAITNSNNSGTVYVKRDKSVDFIESILIPCPKVQAGIKTRWYHGTWVQLSKRYGWVPATWPIRK
jgi:hypothetical protein